MAQGEGWLVPEDGDLSNQASFAPPPRSRLIDVAALAGTSIKTASRALSGSPNVAEATRARVVGAARRLHFRPNGLARELRSGAVSSAVGLVIGDLSNPYYSKVASAAERIFRQSNLELFIASTNEESDREKSIVRTMLERRVQALLIAPASSDHSYLLGEVLVGTPVIFFDRPSVNLSADSFVSNDRVAAYEALRDLLDVHDRITVVADEQTAWTARERLAGINDAANKSGRFGDVSIVLDQHNSATAEASVLRILQSESPPSAIFGLNNLIMSGVASALRKAKVGVALLGFDDSELMDILGVSTISSDPFRVGDLIARRALMRLRNPDLSNENHVMPMQRTVRTPLSEAVFIGQAGPHEQQ